MKTKQLCAMVCAFTGATSLFAATINFQTAPVQGLADLLPTSAAGSVSRIVASFATPQTALSFWYSSYDSITVTAFDSGHNVITTLNSAGNLNLTQFADVRSRVLISSKFPEIAFLTITDNGDRGDLLKINSLSAPAADAIPVPDGANTFALMGAVGCGMLLFRRKLAVAQAMAA